MDDTELEDGEACCVYEEEDGTRGIDPDVALSYIDEKIQNVLGHFQKDFEGVVSVETLGAKYGIYGSFLPTYRRSPVSSHSKTPPRVHNHAASQSPSTVRVEGGHPNSLPQASASQNDLCRQTTRAQLMESVKESTPKSDDSDHKPLKVKIKVGSDNLSGKKSASIFCGLGLDGSPSSLEDNPVESRVLSHRNGLPFEAHESPTHILQMMTSFPVYGGCLLSPLPYDLIQLSGRPPKVLQGILVQTPLKANARNFATGHSKDSTAYSGGGVTKLLDRKDLSMQVKRDNTDNHIGFDFLLKESDIDNAVSCEELISEALKLPLLSSADSSVRESGKALLKEIDYSEMTKTEPLESTSVDISLTDKPNQKFVSVPNAVGNEIGNSREEAVQRRTNTDTVGFVKSKKASRNEQKESQKQKGKKSLSCEGGNNQSSTEHKKKSKKSKVHGITTKKEAMETGGRTFELKDGNFISAENDPCRSVSKDSSIQKTSSKGMDRYKDFFGELDEQEADLMDSPDVPSEDRLKNWPDIPDPVLPKDEKFIEKRRKESKSSLQKSPNQFPGSMKKKQQSTKESPSVNDLECVQLTKSGDTFVETKQHGKTGWQKADLDSDGGCAKMSMTTKTKREPGQECPRISKRSKTRSTQTGDNDSVDYDFANNAARNEQITNSPNTNGRSTSTCQAVDTLQETKSGGSRAAATKRKTDDFQDHPSSTPSSDTFISDKEDFRKKKHRVSKSEGKEHTARNGRADKRVKTVLQRNLDNTESFQKDFSTSSSSKVSGSFKSKACVQEPKGSPVESVSSSPLRITNSGKLTTRSKHILERGNVHDVVKLDIGSPRKHADLAYENGSDRSLIDMQEKSNGCLQSGLANISASKVHRNGGPTILGHDDGDCSEKPCNDSYPLGEDKEMPKYDSSKSGVKMPEFCGNSREQGPVYEKKESSTMFKSEEKCESNVSKTGKDIICHKSEPSTLKSRAHLDHDEMRSSAKFDEEKKVNHMASTSKRETFKCLTSSDGEKNNKSNGSQQYQPNGMSSSSTDASASNLPKELKPNKRTDGQNGSHHTTSQHMISNGDRLKNQESSSPFRRAASTEAARNALKEARNLKHIADRLAKSNGTSESTKFYFEAALKFLHGASLLESGKTEDARHPDVAESVGIYSSTAKLCEFCAHEYERSKDMATAALAYKCMEVAYLRVIRISNQSASKDRHELQTVLQIVPSGESPSSSASDIDNLNNSATGDKAPRARYSDSPQPATDLVITTRNCPNFERLLSFAQNVNLAMEASRKSRTAFAAASVSIEKLATSKDGITSVKRALDFNFHNVDVLLRLVRLAKDMISG